MAISQAVLTQIQTNLEQIPEPDSFPEPDPELPEPNSEPAPEPDPETPESEPGQQSLAPPELDPGVLALA